MKVLNEYPPTHHYIDDYKLTEFFCPNCGKKSVWEEGSYGDYYVGPGMICTSCKSSFTLQGPMDSSSHDLKIVDQLLSGVMLQPTTPKGN